MKKIILTIAAVAAFSAIFTSCDKDNVADKSQDPMATVYAGYDDSKIVMHEGSVYWKAGDVITAGYTSPSDGQKNTKYELSGGQGTKYATFTKISGQHDVDNEAVWVNYSTNNSTPFNTKIFVSRKSDARKLMVTRVYIPEDVDTATVSPAIACTPSGVTTMTFSAIAALIKVPVYSLKPVDGNITIELENLDSEAETICGFMSVTNAAKEDGKGWTISKTVGADTLYAKTNITKKAKASSDGTGFNNYIAIRGGITCGTLRITVKVDGTEVEHRDVKNFSPVVGNLYQVRPFDLSNYGVTDLSAGDKYANTYIIPNATSDSYYKFKAVKGNTSTAVANASAEIAWDTEFVMTDDAKTEATVVDTIIARGDYIYVKAGATAGYAQVVAKDGEGNVTWTWGVWVPATTISTVNVNGTNVMDRDLGAMKSFADIKDNYQSKWQVCNGCLYQFGRNTAFAPHSCLTGDSFKPLAVYSNIAYATVGGPVSMDTAVANPTTFYNGSNVSNWCENSDDNVWYNTAKTEYDPCPYGYRVMTKDVASILESTSTRETVYSYVTFKKEDEGAFTLYATRAGCINFDGAYYTSTVSTQLRTWTSESKSDNIAYAYLDATSAKYGVKEYGKVFGYTIRCIAE